MYLCYVDESGTPELPGNTSHFVLAGISVPVWHWKTCEADISNVKHKYDLADAEIHTGWLCRKYGEQESITNYDKLEKADRIYQVRQNRSTTLLNFQKANNSKAYKQTRKNYRKTEPYIHLSYAERMAFIGDVADKIKGWGFARVFAECIDKVHYNPSTAILSPDEQAFEQIISRFHRLLSNINTGRSGNKDYGMIIHDNNDTVALKHSKLMKKFHQAGTLWTSIEHIIETPLFVNSELTSMVQIADLCSYSIRRYLENSEANLFDKIYERADRKDGAVVGIRHFTNAACKCKICNDHR